MEITFPVGLPLPTAFYLVFYLGTLILHVVFMNYVLAGTGWLAFFYTGLIQREPGPMTRVLKDWMPFMLSGAITAGVAPLLFMQLLYRREFYTANLLLFNRWMAIVPVLIIGFYGLYLLKSAWLHRRPLWVICGVGFVPFFCVLFTGFSWTENHLLSIRDLNFWGEFYASEKQWYFEPHLVPRLLVWALGSLPTLAVILGWQMWYRRAGEGHRLARIAIAGIAMTMLAGGWYALVLDDRQRGYLLSAMAFPYLLLGGLGLVLQLVSWIGQLNSEGYSRTWLFIASVGLAGTLIGMTVCREVMRIQSLGAERFEQLYPAHQLAMSKSGLGLFLTFLVLNAGLIGFCFWLVRNGKQEAVSEPVANHDNPS